MSAMPNNKLTATTTTMSSSNTSNINNINNTNNNNNNNNSNNHHHEQPQTKRQRIEKIKSVKNVKSSKTIAQAPPPDLIDTAAPQQHLSTSLSSSANSIASPSSSNNSPTSTPCSSRATSLTQLLKLPTSTAATSSSLSSTSATASSTAAASSSSSLEGSTFTTSLVAATIATAGTRLCADYSSSCSSSEQSADEVDRVLPSTRLLPDLLPTNDSNNFDANASTANVEFAASHEMRDFEDSLTRQCLCGVSERTLRKPFQSHYSHDAQGLKRIANLCEWPTNKLLQFLSNLQLLFDIYLKQNSKGFICARIMDVCDALIRNDHNLIDEIIVLAGYNNAYVQFLAGRVLASFLVIAKQDMNDDWLKKLVDNLFNFERLNHVAVQKIHFSLEIIKRIVEWKDIDLHPLEDELEGGGVGGVAADERNAGISMGQTQATTSSSAETHSYLHFQAQQPTLATNYFAVHFGAQQATAATHAQHDEDIDEEDVDEDAEDDIEEDVEEDIEEDLDVDADLDDDADEEDVEYAARFAPFAQSNGDAHLAHLNALQQQQMAAHFHNFNYANNGSNTSSNHMQNRGNLHEYAANIDVNYAVNAAANSTSHSANNSTSQPAANSSSNANSNCHLITLTDSESFDTTHLKCITIKILENKWPALVKNMSTLIANHLDIENAENCILNFLQLWENIISVKANLSIVETLPFYAQLNKFELLLNQQLSCTLYKQMLCLFNEALCYGSTLALQDMLPDETCLLAHQIVRHVKDFRILESLPRRQPENIVSLIGFKRKPVVYAERASRTWQPRTQQMPQQLAGGDAIEMDKTILQKMVLLVLKSIAVTVKEIRSDSSSSSDSSSIDSSDFDAYQDMVLIERSIRDVLRKLESFIKNTLEFHPECHFSKILIHLFDDQDDHLIEAMVCTLDVTAVISFRNNAFPELVAMLNPVYTFLEFLKMISNSSDLLLDLLVSNETCFLLYLLRFLKYIRMNWTLLVQSCHDFGMGANTLDEAMSVLIRLRLQISRLVSRQLYPYDISPVLRLLESCESLYEGNELS